MIKPYQVISGLRGILKEDKIQDVELEYSEHFLDLAQVNAIFPDVYSSTISNWEEHNKARDDKWHKENPNPSSYQHPPSMMTYVCPSERPCTTIQIGSQLFHFDEDSETMFDLVIKEKRK